MKKTIGILTLVCAICITVATAHAYSTSKTTTIEYGKYITMIEAKTDAQTYTSIKANTKHKDSLIVKNNVYTKENGILNLEAINSVAINNTTETKKHYLDLGKTAERRSLWQVITSGSSMTGTFSLGTY